MRVMLVDDERLALQGLENRLRKADDLEIVGMYQDPVEAYQEVLRLRPDLLFLDIDMPELNGLAFAERLNQLLPHIQIIFVTAHSRHAIAAFEQETLDYLLKPLQAERLALSLQRARARLQSAVSFQEETVHIRMLGGLELETGLRDKVLPVWRTQKTKELYAYLLHVDGRLVRKEILARMLWDDFEETRAYARLYTAAYQLRKALAGLGASGLQLLSADEGYCIPREGLETDVERWERGVARAPELTRQTMHQHIELIGLYRGDYLEGLDYPWAESRRQQLRLIWYYHTMRVARFLKDEQMLIEAKALCEQIRQRYPEEAEYLGLLAELELLQIG
ncbi:response regulator [Paenibacillus sp. 1P07SE]|uniref:response regulator n=1 Tax=Paenibacillus sp. 1P07SE TaxID=3132209 RepID=UPI0039A40710